jgi:hypothetical protein
VAEAEAALMLPRIDFDLQLERLPASCFGGELEHEMNQDRPRGPRQSTAG